MEFRTLQNITEKTLYEAFIDAFSGYAVKIDVTFAQFLEMISSRNFDPKYSIGCFIEGQLAGFILCGIRNYGKVIIGYDIATGVVTNQQRKGIGKRILQELIEQLKENGVHYFRLEVLEKNITAINLYTNQGFNIIRKLECFESGKEELIFPESNKYHFSKDPGKLAKLDLDKFEIYRPTWQNDLVTIGNSIDKHVFRAIEKHGNIVGFGFIHRENGRIPQIGILPEWRNQGLEAILIGGLITETQSGKVAFINVEAESYLSETLDNIGVTSNIGQFEMELDLKEDLN